MELLKNIVVLGGGFGGLHAAYALARALKKQKLEGRYKIVLVDRTAYHTFTPRIYEVAAVPESSVRADAIRAAISFPLRSLAKYSNVEFKEDSIVRIDSERQTIFLQSQELPYEYLILAAGSETHYFDIPGLEQHAYPLKTLDDALSIRKALAGLRESQSSEPVHIAVVGGGPTGVEVASEIKMRNPKFPISLIDPHARILSDFDSRISNTVQTRLQKLGVHVVLHECVKRATDTTLVLESGEKIYFDLLIWTGGVRANKVTSALPFRKNERGSIIVDTFGRCQYAKEGSPIDSHVYAIGDIAYFHNEENGQTAPARARHAIIESTIATNHILQEIERAEGLPVHARSSPSPYIETPYVIPVGGKYAITKVGPFIIQGHLAHIFMHLIELNYFLSIMPFGTALAAWLKSSLTF